MATAKKAAAKPVPTGRRKLAPTPDDAVVRGAAGAVAKPVPADKSMGEDKVIVHVPTAFRLTQQNYVMVDYPAGIYPMPKEHAEHPYSKACGVKLHES